GVGILFGVQDKFSWASVAASAAAAPLSAKLGGKVKGSVEANGGGKFMTSLATGLTTGGINQAAYALATGGRINYVQLVGDAFGNALGNSLINATNNSLPAELRGRPQADIDAYQAAIAAGYARRNALASITDPSIRSMFVGTQIVNEYLGAH